MEIKITEQKQQPLLERAEITGELSYESVTPSRAELRRKIAEQLKVSEDLVVVDKIMPVFGKKESRITVHVYQKKEDAARYESKVNLQRAEGKKKGEVKEEKAKETKKEKEETKKGEKKIEEPKKEKEQEKPKVKEAEETPKEEKTIKK